jgi:hypothetical protein
MRNHFLIATALAATACAPAATTTHTEQPKPEQVRRANSTTMHSIGIPPGQLPHAGRCRIWIPGRAPGHQPDARSCEGIAQAAPPGSWIIYRTMDNRTHVHVMDPSHRGTIYVVRLYDEHGVWVKDENAGEHREVVDQPEPSSPANGNSQGRRRT